MTFGGERHFFFQAFHVRLRVTLHFLLEAFHVRRGVTLQFLLEAFHVRRGVTFQFLLGVIDTWSKPLFDSTELFRDFYRQTLSEFFELRIH